MSWEVFQTEPLKGFAPFCTRKFIDFCEQSLPNAYSRPSNTC
jgi:hypothetical protein